MLIRELNIVEIEAILQKIESLKNDKYYQYYFTENEKLEFPERAFLIDEQYYVDFTFYENKCFMGLINLEKNTYKKNSFYNLMKLFKEMLNYYKDIWLWCYIENHTAFRFHKFLKSKYHCNHFIKNKFSVLEVIKNV